jgi:hypothetical protein
MTFSILDLTFAPPSASIFANIRTPTHRKTENKGFTLVIRRVRRSGLPMQLRGSTHYTLRITAIQTRSSLGIQRVQCVQLRGQNP